MLFIHRSDLICHGNLSSSACVITSRWVLQITGFGLHTLKQEDLKRRKAKDGENGRDFNKWFAESK